MTGCLDIGQQRIIDNTHQLHVGHDFGENITHHHLDFDEDHTCMNEGKSLSHRFLPRQGSVNVHEMVSGFSGIVDYRVRSQGRRFHPPWRKSPWI